MFEYLADYRIVLVSGPHRSGTTIVTKMIAHDTGLRFCPEETFGHDNLTDWLSLIAKSGRCVIQCPTMCSYLVGPGLTGDVAVVMVWRDLADVLASQARVGWTPTGVYRGRYRAELALYDTLADTLAETKYRAWDTSQRLAVVHPFEIEYESLDVHPLWLPKAARVGFGPRQIAL